MIVYDCSNSVERPANRGYGGLVENAVVTMLKEYGPQFDLYFTDSPQKADLVFTNDVFPQSVLTLDRPKVKRMDGTFWQSSLANRNIPLIEARQQADLTIFISRFSRESLFSLYPRQLRHKSIVVLNWVDETIFYPPEKQNTKPKKFIAVATSWAREEKRLPDLLWFAKNVLLPTNKELYLVGTLPDMKLDPNVIPLGYMSPYRLANTLREMDGLLNFSYRDAAPKVVAEAICCGLPVFYAGSGGASELAAVTGVGFADSFDMSSFQELTPKIDRMNSFSAWTLFLDAFPALRANCLKTKGTTEQMVKKYIEAFKSVLK